MSDDVERELEAMLRERAGAVSETVEPPADLDAELLRRRVMARRRKAVIGGLAIAAVLAGTVVTVAALSDAPTKKRVDVTHPPTTIATPAPTPAAGAGPVPGGTAFVSLDTQTGAVLALDENGKALRTLFMSPMGGSAARPSCTRSSQTFNFRLSARHCGIP